MNPPTGVSQSGRHIIIGKNSKIWKILSETELVSKIDIKAIGHNELRDHNFSATDTVWIFSYSRNNEENLAIFQYLKLAGVLNVNYISSASTNVVEVTRCYEYPRVKLEAQIAAQNICKANILVIGYFYSHVGELPGGLTVATSKRQLIDFFIQQHWDPQSRVEYLFEFVDRPFTSELEKFIYSVYGFLQRAFIRFPCALRPVDYILRGLSMRWYGYLYLSNKIWFMKTSSSDQD